MTPNDKDNHDIHLLKKLCTKSARWKQSAWKLPTLDWTYKSHVVHLHPVIPEGFHFEVDKKDLKNLIYQKLNNWTRLLLFVQTISFL